MFKEGKHAMFSPMFWKVSIRHTSRTKHRGSSGTTPPRHISAGFVQSQQHRFRDELYTRSAGHAVRFPIPFRTR